MSVEGLRRPVVLSLAVVAAFATTYLLYQTYVANAEDASQGLRRSNALRRPRRRRAQTDLQRARNEGVEEDNNTVRPDGLSANGSRPLQRALINLELAARNNLADGEATFGHYRNETLLPASTAGTVDFSTALNPTTLEDLFRNIVALSLTLTEAQQRSLRQHIQTSFVRELVTAFWPEGQLPDASDRLQLETALARFGLGRDLVGLTILGLRMRDPIMPQHWTFNTPYQEGRIADVAAVDGTTDDYSSTYSPHVELEDEVNEEQGHNMLNLLYHIAQEQAKKNGYVHRGVECNSCAACPIQGVRYHCANCFDYDLCETCESKGVHIRTHVFYKIRIPAPPRGQIKQVIPKWYPGNPSFFPHNLPKELADELKEATGLDNPDLQGLYDQYKCIAGHLHPSDPTKLGMAMDRKAFDMYFIPLPSDRQTPANLIYDRIFAFYDANDDGVIDFTEFVQGITKLNDKSFMARLRRLFHGFDLDNDGYVSRKDFLRMLRAHYDLSTQLSREMIARNEDMDLQDEMRETVQGSHPISSAFGGSIPHGHLSRPGLDKEIGDDGDLEIINPPNGVLQDDLEMTADRHQAIGDVATGSRSRHHPFRSFRPDPARDEQMVPLHNQNNVEVLAIQHADDASEAELTGPDPPLQTYGWPPLLTPEPQDIISSLNADIPIEDITDPVDRSRVVYAQSQRLDAESDNLDAHKRQVAVNERWRRRQFYLDEEEGMRRPVGYAEPDSSDDESDDPAAEIIDSPRRHSLRSRSSSKVRFDDSAIDTDYETRSNTSSRSGVPNERWGGYELSRPTADVGADILYAAVQQGFNELLDPLFSAKEELGLEAISTRRQRGTWKNELDTYAADRASEDEDLNEALLQADKLRTDELLQRGPSSSSQDAERFQVNFDGPDVVSLETRRAADEIQAQINEAINNVNAASALSRDATPDPPRAPAPETVGVARTNEFREPMLPQFRPDDTAEAASTSKPPPAPSPPTGQDLQEEETAAPSPPSKPMLARWLRHRRIEAEAKARGGHGRLSFLEFRQLVEAQTKKDRGLRSRDGGSGGGAGARGERQTRSPEDIVSQAAQGEGPTGAEARNGDDVQGAGDGDEAAYWEKNANLGKLAFLSAWLEMAGF